MFEHRKLRKQIDHAAPLDARGVEGTIVRATGIVRATDKRLVAPATGRIAVIYGITAPDNSPHEPQGFNPRTPFTDVEVVPFALEVAGVGSVRVESVFATLVDIPYIEGDAERDEWTAYADSKGLTWRHPKEAVVQPGHRVTVVGTVTRRATAPAVEAGFRDGGSELCLVGDFDRPLIVAPGQARP